MGRPRHPGRSGVPVPAERPGRRRRTTLVACYPEPGRRHRVRARPVDVGDDRRGEPGDRPTWPTTSQALLLRRTGAGRVHLPARPRRRLLRTRRAGAQVLGRASPAAPRCGSASTRSSPAAGARRRRDVSELDFALHRRAPGSRARPARRSRCACTSPRPPARRCTRWRCAASCASSRPRRRYDDTEAAALRDLFGERARWGDTLKPMQLGFLNHVVPELHRRDRHRAAAAVQLRRRRRRATSTSTASTTARCRCCCCSAARSSRSGAERHLACEPVPWHKEAQFRLPIAVWQQAMELHFPGTAWAAAGPRHVRRACSATAAASSCAAPTTRCSGC